MIQHTPGKRLTLNDLYCETFDNNYPYSDVDDFEIKAMTDEYNDLMTDDSVEEYTGLNIQSATSLIDKIEDYKNSQSSWYHSVVTIKMHDNRTTYLSNIESENTNQEQSQQFQVKIQKLIQENYVRVYPADIDNDVEDAAGGVFLLYEYDIDKGSPNRFEMN